MHRLFDKFLSPENPADTPYKSNSDVISVREADGGSVVVEIFKRLDGMLGFRFQAWVAWRDAGGGARSHSWHEIMPSDSIIVDRIDDAQYYAESYATSAGLPLTSQWQNV